MGRYPCYISLFTFCQKHTHTHHLHTTKKDSETASSIFMCVFRMYICIYLFLGEYACESSSVRSPHAISTCLTTLVCYLLLSLFLSCSLSISSHSKCINTKCFFCKSVSDCTLLHEITQLLIRWPFVIRSSLFHLDKSTAMKTMLIPTKKIRRKINLT